MVAVKVADRSKCYFVLEILPELVYERIVFVVSILYHFDIDLKNCCKLEEYSGNLNYKDHDT